MRRPKVKMLNKGSRQILKSPEVQADIQRRVERIATHAGDGFEAGVEEGRTRVLGSVMSTTYHAMRAEAKDRALTRALDAARD